MAIVVSSNAFLFSRHGLFASCQTATIRYELTALLLRNEFVFGAAGAAPWQTAS
jgi:hypothetical protein